jgi:adenylate cyclase
MPGDPNKLSQFWPELKRRRVIRIIIVYAAAGFAIIEFVDIVTEPLNLPDWALALVIILVAIGFPFAIIFSWIFDITPKGIKKTKPIKLANKKGEDVIESDKESRFDNSIAVLPFQDMSPQKDQEYFCDGMTEEIINALTHVESLKVIARTSAFAFKDKQKDIREIGKKLDVETVLEGSIRKDGNHLRITAQLIKVTDGSHIWSERYDRDLVDVFAIQDEISLAIVEALKVRLLKKEEVVMKKRHTENVGSYESFMMGQYFFGRWEFEKALHHLNQAVDKDQNLALAYAAIAEIYWLSGTTGTDINPEDALIKAQDAIESALRIDDKLAESYVASGLINLYFNRNLTAAERDFKKAEGLNPNSPKVHHGWTDYYMIMGQVDKALEKAEKAIELDPMFLEYLHHVGGFYCALGQYDDAMKLIEKAKKLDPDNIYTYTMLSWYHGYQGSYREIIDITQKALEKGLIGRIQLLFRMGHWYGLSGEDQKARHILNEMLELKKQKYISSTYIAFIYTGLGEKDTAFNWLNRAYYEKDPILIAIKNYHEIYIAPIRSDPRFNILLNKLGLPEE